MAMDEAGEPFDAADPAFDSVGDALPRLPAWAAWGETWAPDAVEIDGEWLLYFAALFGDSGLHCIGNASSSTPTGPFVPFEEPLVCDLDAGGNIDPSVFVDSVGDAYLLWKIDANAIGGDSSL